MQQKFHVENIENLKTSLAIVKLYSNFYYITFIIFLPVKIHMLLSY